MARDRLAPMRQGGEPYGSAPTSRQTRANPYDQRNDYELAQFRSGGQYDNNQYNSASGNDMSAFLDEISSIQGEIRSFNANVEQISRLHTQLLGTVEPSNSRSNQQLDNMIEETRAMIDQLKRRIQALQRQPDEKAARERRPHIERVRDNFKRAVEGYQDVEREYREKYKDRLKRQFKIVNPNATQDEIDQVVNSDQGGQVFAQAMMGNRHAESQSAYREVQQRHEEIRRIVTTIAELDQLFKDMGFLVEQQNDLIINIDNTAAKVEEHTEKAQEATGKGVITARGYRKKRFICLFLTLIILIIVGVAVGVTIANNNKKN